MDRPLKMVLISRAVRVLSLVVLLFAVMTVARNVFELAGAQGAFDFSVTLNSYSLSLAPSHGGSVRVTVSLTSGSPQNVTLSSSVSPQDGDVSTSLSQPVGIPSFSTTLSVSVFAAPPGKTYTVTVTGSAQGLTRQSEPLTVTVNCPQGPCPQPHVDSTDKTSYSQGESIQFRGSGFYPGDAIASCLTTDNNVISTCQNQAAADAHGDVSGSMQVGSNIPPGPQQFYLQDLTNDQQSAKVQLTILPPSALLTTTYSGQGSIAPSCASGCPEQVGMVVNVTATQAVGWTFSGWTVAGASCAGGLASNPCSFTMPSNPVSVTANFIQLLTATSGTTVSATSVVQTTSSATSVIQTTVSAMSVIQTTTVNTLVIGSTATSTITTYTQSTIQLSGTQTTQAYSTVLILITQTQNLVTTQLSTFKTTSTIVTTMLGDPPLEIGLAVIILLSALLIGVNVLKQFPRRPVISCAHCGFKNSSARKYCVSCGEPLKGP